MYEKLGLKGLVTNDEFPSAGQVLHEGSIGYHRRSGKHYFSREVWNKLVDYLDD